ncbi:MAG: 2-phospho-L-lactate guanylyltransferase [Myxococcota bacterium]
MWTAAAVPVTDFARAKRRLRARFDDRAVERILRALLADVLGALAQAKRIEQVFVLSDDPAVAEAARASGASVSLRVPDPGLNAVIDAAAAERAADGFDALLVVLGDLPLLTGPDVDSLVEAGERAPVVIAPADDGGTALLFRRPPLVIPARFGPESASAHEAVARERGVTPLLWTSLPESAQIDLDTPEDAERLARAPRACRTRDVLRELLR